jgi:hypothetical protein
VVQWWCGWSPVFLQRRHCFSPGTGHKDFAVSKAVRVHVLMCLLRRSTSICDSTHDSVLIHLSTQGEKLGSLKPTDPHKSSPTPRRWNKESQWYSYLLTAEYIDNGHRKFTIPKFYFILSNILTKNIKNLSRPNYSSHHKYVAIVKLNFRLTESCPNSFQNI